jgi:hypothetical protein
MKRVPHIIGPAELNPADLVNYDQPNKVVGLWWRLADDIWMHGALKCQGTPKAVFLEDGD